MYHHQQYHFLSVEKCFENNLKLNKQTCKIYQLQCLFSAIKSKIAKSQMFGINSFVDIQYNAGSYFVW